MSYKMICNVQKRSYTLKQYLSCRSQESYGTQSLVLLSEELFGITCIFPQATTLLKTLYSLTVLLRVKQKIFIISHKVQYDLPATISQSNVGAQCHGPSPPLIPPAASENILEMLFSGSPQDLIDQKLWVLCSESV